MKKALVLSALAFALAAQAQTTSTGTGSSAAGNQAAPMAQPGTGTRNKESRKDDQTLPTLRNHLAEAQKLRGQELRP